jgi:hypothetical protein
MGIDEDDSSFVPAATLGTFENENIDPTNISPSTNSDSCCNQI